MTFDNCSLVIDYVPSPWHFLNFLPEPQWHGSLGFILRLSHMKGECPGGVQHLLDTKPVRKRRGVFDLVFT